MVYYEDQNNASALIDKGGASIDIFNDHQMASDKAEVPNKRRTTENYYKSTSNANQLSLIPGSQAEALPTKPSTRDSKG